MERPAISNVRQVPSLAQLLDIGTVAIPCILGLFSFCFEENLSNWW
jgi:hypothetical protein